MQPPIPLGTLLQKRYRVTKVLGQGGFGRTYLSQDTGCFDEICVLKEFSPNDRGRDALKKSKELFQREAKVLYQINHPQIPKFRANFEEQKRLFLVQEYAEGKTVAKSLSDKLKNNQTFTEAEAVDFLNNMLPVLTHIHGMGVIHRDISPDNVIFRDRDKLPVLIDFGVVKAGVTKLEASKDIQEGTTVGKAGYAPGEQLQTGEAYANSDLYALAVTVVVMMTGRKPESLIDKSTMTWKWHQWVPTLTPWFAKILNKMLSRAPNSRYQSASEVAQALRSVSDFVGSSTAKTDDRTAEVSQANAKLYPRSDYNKAQNGPQESVPLSRLKKSTGTNSTGDRSPQNPLRGIFNTPWGVALGSGVAALIFIILPIFLISRSLTVPVTGTKSTPSTPQANISPTSNPSSEIDPPPSNPTSVSVTPVVSATTESLILEVGKPIVKEGTLNPAQSIVYTIPLQIGQELKAILTANPSGATMNILAPNQANVDVYAKNTTNWQGNLPLSGEYRLEILAPTGASASNYKLEATLTANLAPAPTPSTSATPSLLPSTTP